MDPTQRFLTASSRAEPIALLRTVFIFGAALEDWFDHVHDRRLNDAISHCRNPQWSGLRRSRLGNMHAANGLGAVRAGFQLVRQFPNDFGKLLLERRHRHMVHSRSPLVLRNLLQPSRQIPFREHFVKQPKPCSSFHSLFESRQHAGGPDVRFHPAPTRENLTLGRGRSSLLSLRHYHWFVFRSSGHPTSIFLEPFAPPELPGFITTMVPLTPARLSPAGQVSLLHGSNLPNVPTPTTPRRPEHHEFVFYAPV